jgi:hypothetical protein
MRHIVFEEMGLPLSAVPFIFSKKGVRGKKMLGIRFFVPYRQYAVGGKIGFYAESVGRPAAQKFDELKAGHRSEPSGRKSHLDKCPHFGRYALKIKDRNRCDLGRKIGHANLNSRGRKRLVGLWKCRASIQNRRAWFGAS